MVDIIYENEVENDEELSMNGNEYLLKVAFANLIENACKFSDNKKCVISIVVHPQQIKLCFVDEGIGICEEEIAQIFTPFFRGTNKKYTDGNGIGLSLTQKIVKLHYGEISVSSLIGKGTKFIVTFEHL